MKDSKKHKYSIDVNIAGKTEKVLFSLKDLKDMKLNSVYKKLFTEFEEAFPYWINIQELSESFQSLNYQDIISLKNSEFLEKHPSDKYRFRLSPQGFNVVNSIKNNETGNRIKWLTWILIVLTIILIIKSF